MSEVGGSVSTEPPSFPIPQTTRNTTMSTLPVRRYVDAVNTNLKRGQPRHLDPEVLERVLPLLRMERPVPSPTIEEHRNDLEELYRWFSGANFNLLHVPPVSEMSYDDIDSCLNALRSEGWAVNTASVATIMLTSPEDIEVTGMDDSGEEITVNFGRMVALINSDSFAVTVDFPSQDITPDGNRHPHVNSYGSVCFGDYSDTFSGCIGRGELALAIDILIATVTNYGSDNPYSRLEEFRGVKCDECGAFLTAAQVHICRSPSCSRSVCVACTEGGLTLCHRHRAFCDECNRWFGTPGECPRCHGRSESEAQRSESRAPVAATVNAGFTNSQALGFTDGPTTRREYDEDGYDENGYDREGYDSDGYDRDGYDRDGYDVDGYNRDDA